MTIDDARRIAATLPRSDEALVRDQVRFRVGRTVYASFYLDDTIMGLMPRPSEIRYQWVWVRLNAIDAGELRELLVDAWRMCVPKKLGAAYEG